MIGELLGRMGRLHATLSSLRLCSSSTCAHLSVQFSAGPSVFHVELSINTCVDIRAHLRESELSYPRLALVP